METNWIEKIKKKELCNFFGEIPISTKSVTLFAGENTIGKTATCLHISKFVIENKFSVLYFDTEKKLIDRPEPNLLNVFLKDNFDGFKNHFFIENKLFDMNKDEIDTSYFESKIKEKKPDLVVIDSIYTPFVTTFPEARARAGVIGQFLRYVREIMIQHDIAIVITTKIGRVVKERKEQMAILGGQELLYNCDTKAKMEVREDKLKERRVVFDVDMQKKFILILEYGGYLKKVK